jgi:hypothetical protein
MRIDSDHLPIWGWILIAIILFVQSSWLFKDAQENNANPWIWGIWGLIQAPTPFIIYLFVVKKIHKKNERSS